MKPETEKRLAERLGFRLKEREGKLPHVVFDDGPRFVASEQEVALWQLCGELMEKDEWVKCSKRLPKVGIRVLVWYRGDTWTARLSDEGRHYKLWLLPTGHAELKEVSHWRPLPHPPEGN